MDSRDSSSSMTAGRDGPGGEEDGVLSVTAALAKDAALYFQSGKFVECVDVLNQLKQKKENDPKVLHNIALAEYFRDGCSDPKGLLEGLKSLKMRNEELACASGELPDAVSNLANKVLGSKGSSMSAQSTSIIYADEFDTSLATLNIAIVWYHLHKYRNSLSVLEPLFQNIEPIDETTALQICLLLLDVVLACRDAPRFAAVLNYMEKAFGVGYASQGENGSGAQQSLIQVSKSSSLPSSSLSADASNLDLAAGEHVSENPLSRTLSEETLEYDNVLLEIGGQNLARASDLSSKDFPKVVGNRCISTVDLKLKLQLYKVRFLLLTRNLKLAKREVKLAMNIARGRDSSLTLLLKAQLEYARLNYRKAIKLLVASCNQTASGISSMFSNNLGCIYYQLGKYHTSSVLFSRALSNCSSLRKEKPLKLSTLSQDRSLLLTYNCGLAYLACGKPILAARCFQKASVVFYKQPLLWLRLAECCLMALQKGLLELNHVPLERSEVKVHVVGNGKWRQLLMEENGHVDQADSVDIGSGSEKWPKLSFTLARLSLSNALHLLSGSDSISGSGVASVLEEGESNEGSLSKPSTVSAGSGQVSANGEAKEQKGGTSQEVIHNSLSLYEGICAKENLMIKQAVLANLAYVELVLENPMKALVAAKSLLEVPDCSRINIFLGHIYAAESLCLLNKPKEAAEHLSVYLSKRDSFEMPFHQEDCEKWRADRTTDCEDSNGGSAKEQQDFAFLSPEEARGTLYADLAALCAMQGDLARAHHLVTQALSLMPVYPQVMLTAMYVDLMLGKSAEALLKLKQCRRVRFLSSNLQLNKSS